MPRSWSSREIQRLLITGTSCLCLIILVAGVVLAVLLGKLSPQILGNVSMAGTGAGLLGIFLIVYFFMKASVEEKQR